MSQMKSSIISNIPDYNGIGIYCITNNNSGKKYIGSSINVKLRLQQHISSFKKLKCSVAFREDIAKGDTFTASILEKIDYGANQFFIFERESHYIQLYDTIKTGYNHAPTTASTKEELLRSLKSFQKDPEMVSYIENLIKKRETPIFEGTILKRDYVEPYKSLRIYLPKSTVDSLYKHLSDLQDNDINKFINRAITETMERDNNEQ